METKPKHFVFVLRPFGEEFDEFYKLGIKVACENAGAYCERVDEQDFTESILSRIYNQIAKADSVIADMSTRNPNVFYETGYAHALNKQVILLTQKSNDIPFNLNHYPHIIYGGKIIPLRQQLESKIRWCVGNPKKSLATVEVNLEFFVNRIPLEPNTQIVINGETVGDGSLRFDLPIGVHNLAPKVLSPNAYSLALIVPPSVEVTERNVSRPSWMAAEKQLLNIRITETLFPEGWYSIYLNCRIPKYGKKALPRKLSLAAAFRLFTELGPTDVPFQIIVKSNEKEAK